MALQQLRSSTANKRPTAAAMSDGQLAINTNADNSGLFFKDADGDIRKVGPVFVGSTAPNASPASGGSTGHSVGEQWLDNSGGTYVLKIWDGTAWRSESGTFVDVNGDTMTGALLLDNAASASAPDLSFDGDANTGIYSPGADQVAIATGGTGRLFIDSSGRLLVGTTSSVSSGGGDLLEVASGVGNILITSTNSSRVVNQACGQLRFWGKAGANEELAKIAAVADGTHGAGDKATRPTFSVTADGASSPTERMRIDSSGRLLVGTTGVGTDTSTLYAPLQVVSGTGAYGITIRNRSTDDYGFLTFSSNNGNEQLTNIYTQKTASNTAEMILATNGGNASPTERMRITSGGALRIGQSTTDEPASNDTRGVGISGTGILSACNTGARALEIGRTENDSASREVVRWFRNGSLVQTITTTATTVSYPTGSDYRLKENITDMTGAIDRVKNLSPKRFNFIAEPGVEKDGFIAHELETVVPQAVVGTKDQVDENGNPVWQGVDHSFMVPLLTGALQEAIAKIETLEAKVAALEAG